jgi:hypothetical protein
VHDNFRDEAKEEELEQTQSKSEACPVMSVLQDLQAIAIELNLTIKVHVVESLHGDLIPSAIPNLIRLVLEGKVMFDWASGKSGLFVLARSEHGVKQPEGGEDGDGGKESKEDGSLQPPSYLP